MQSYCCVLTFNILNLLSFCLPSTNYFMFFSVIIYPFIIHDSNSMMSINDCVKRYSDCHNVYFIGTGATLTAIERLTRVITKT